jgi:hypothetical protein
MKLGLGVGSVSQFVPWQLEAKRKATGRDATAEVDMCKLSPTPLQINSVDWAKKRKYVGGKQFRSIVTLKPCSVYALDADK